MVDRLLIKDLRARTIVGVHEWEQAQPREVRIDLDLTVDLEAAARSDELVDAVDYGAVCRLVVAHATASRCRLVERLAGSIAELVFEHFAGVRALTVRVDKPGAVRGAGGIAVELTRSRD